MRFQSPFQDGENTSNHLRKIFQSNVVVRYASKVSYGLKIKKIMS